MELSSHSRHHDEIEQRKHVQTKTQRRKRRSPKKKRRADGNHCAGALMFQRHSIWNFLFFYTSDRRSLVSSPLRKPGRRAQSEHITSMMPKHEATAMKLRRSISIPAATRLPAQASTRKQQIRGHPLVHPATGNMRCGACSCNGA